MEISIDPDWRTRFIRAAHAVTASERTALARVAASGRLHRVARGVYRDPPAARRPEVVARELVYAHELRTAGRRVFVNESAAAMWRLPSVGEPSSLVHVADGAGGGHSSRSVRRHAIGVPGAVDVIDGIRVTTLAETVVSVMRTRALAGGLAAADAALAGVEEAGGRRVVHADLAALIGDVRGRGLARARQVLVLADGAAGSPGESVSRASMFRAGLPAPLLQYGLEDRVGRMFGDFCWPEQRLIGEFDGLGKYLRHEWTGGRDAAHVVIDEKRREDRIRALGWRVVRWGWAEAVSPAALSAVLVGAGLPQPSARLRTSWARTNAPE